MGVYYIDPKSMKKKFSADVVEAHDFKPMGQIVDAFTGTLMSVFYETSRKDAKTGEMMVCTEEGLETAINRMGVVARGRKSGPSDLFHKIRKSKAQTLCSIFSAEKAALDAGKTGHLQNPCIKTQYVLSELYRQGLHSRL